MALDIKETEQLLNNENRWDRKRMILQLAISYRKSNQNFSTTHYIFQNGLLMWLFTCFKIFQASEHGINMCQIAFTFLTSRQNHKKSDPFKSSANMLFNNGATVKPFCNDHLYN